ncbi:UDP-N-acetylmuramate dehydrogenase [Candidatus Falkowbacteria bacterium]|nr:MAG: UDP-N-acetylmuramate dehydrogenase [Candidatus Falkowbacteria bacterium]
MIIEELIQKDYPLAPLSTYKIGGPAEFFMAVSSQEELKGAIAWAKEHSQPITILGGGSNILIHDQGIKGLVIKLDNNTIITSDTTMIVGASSNVWTVAETAWEKKLSGIEWSIGIPGSMGGAIRGNAGAHGGSFDTVVSDVVAFDIQKLEFFKVKPTDCHFAYRHSIFKEKSDWVVWEVTLQLSAGDPEIMKQQIQEYKNYRLQSQPKEPSAGCVFKNLLVSEIEKSSPAVIEMASQEGRIKGGKIGVGYLIQKLGLMGYSVGGAKISEIHANFVVNNNQAQAKDVAEIMEYVRAQIKKNYNIELENEIQYLGF